MIRSRLYISLNPSAFIVLVVCLGGGWKRLPMGDLPCMTTGMIIEPLIIFVKSYSHIETDIAARTSNKHVKTVWGQFVFNTNPVVIVHWLGLLLFDYKRCIVLCPRMRRACMTSILLMWRPFLWPPMCWMSPLLLGFFHRQLSSAVDTFPLGID